MSDLDTLHKQAMALLYQERLEEAEQKYKEILHFDENNGEAWSNLGVIYEKMGQSQKALQMISKSLQVATPKPIDLCRMGWILERMSDIPRAIQVYQKSIALDPQWMDAYRNLVRLFFVTGNLGQSESLCKQALTINSNADYMYYVLGKIYLQQNKLDDAIAAHAKALQLNAKEPIYFTDLGVAYQARANDDRVRASYYQGFGCYNQNQYQEAIPHFLNFLKLPKIEIQEHSIQRVYTVLAECFQNLQQDEEAIAVYQEGIQLYPNASNLYFPLVQSLNNVGRTQDAIAVAIAAVQRLPNEGVLNFANYLILPILYHDRQEIDFHRNRFTQGLENLMGETSLTTSEGIEQAWKGINSRTNFYLHYQGYNDRTLQIKYGQFVHQIMAAKYPEWTKSLPMPPLSEKGKIRIGYVSPCLWNHTVGKLFLGWMRNCNRQKFEIYSYHLRNNFDHVTSQFQVFSDSFYHLNQPDSEENRLKTLCDRIIRDRLHILVFLDIGMQAFVSNLAGLRLAPIQCMTWGHPVTSGLPTMDYFVSSDLMEPLGAEAHYSEKLVRLPNIGIAYAKPAISEPTLSRADFHLRQDAIVYLCCQSLLKYLPQHDYIFAEIARRVPQSQFAFISRLSPGNTDKFRRRLQHTFANLGLNSDRYCVILPQKLDQLRYWNLNLVSDIFLDTFVWSGGNTTLEAIACDLPIVTCPGEFMRGRHSYAILKMLGVTETLASNEAEYIKIAVRLGLDSAWRNNIIQKMKQRHSYLYDDKVCVAALEEFYHYAVQHHRSSFPDSSWQYPEADSAFF